MAVPAYNIPLIAPPLPNNLATLHDQFADKVRITGCSITAASFLIVGALIVISCSCLCLTLPGVNVMNDIVLKAVLPASGALLLSIPFVVLGVLKNREKNAVRKQLITAIAGEISTNLATITGLPKAAKTAHQAAYNDQVDYLLINFLSWQKMDPHNRRSNWIKNTNWTKEYQGKLLGEVRETLDKQFPQDKTTRTQQQKDILEAFDDARARIYAKK